jgi:hypothetical protein
MDESIFPGAMLLGWSNLQLTLPLPEALAPSPGRRTPGKTSYSLISFDANFIHVCQ